MVRMDFAQKAANTHRSEQDITWTTSFRCFPPSAVTACSLWTPRHFFMWLLDLTRWKWAKAEKKNQKIKIYVRYNWTAVDYDFAADSRWIREIQTFVRIWIFSFQITAKPDFKKTEMESPHVKAIDAGNWFLRFQEVLVKGENVLWPVVHYLDGWVSLSFVFYVFFLCLPEKRHL